MLQARVMACMCVCFISFSFFFHGTAQVFRVLMPFWTIRAGDFYYRIIIKDAPPFSVQTRIKSLPDRFSFRSNQKRNFVFFPWIIRERRRGASAWQRCIASAKNRNRPEHLVTMIEGRPFVVSRFLHGFLA